MHIPAPKNSLDLLDRNREIKTYYGEDTFFVSCRYSFNEAAKFLRIDIDEQAPLVVANANVNKDFGCNAPTLAEARKTIDGTHVLLGSGSFLWVGNKIALLERNGPVAFSGHWTNPSGMCGESPFTTARKELAEELGLFDVRDNRFITFDGHYKAPTIKYLKPNLFAQHEPSRSTKEKISKASYTTFGMSYALTKVSGERISVSVVAGKLIATRQFAHVNFDESTNTLALNLAFSLAKRYSIGHKNNQPRFYPVDAEPFGRKADLFYRSEALKLPLVPTTKAYLESRGWPR